MTVMEATIEGSGDMEVRLWEPRDFFNQKGTLIGFF
jgi:hypothetical protein